MCLFLTTQVFSFANVVSTTATTHYSLGASARNCHIYEVLHVYSVKTESGLFPLASFSPPLFFHALWMTADELSSLSGNDIIPRARRSAAIASQRRTASEIGRFVGRGHDDDDDSDEDGQLGGSFATPSAGVGDGESDDEAELEF